MASSMLSSATVTPRTGPAEASLVAPFAGLKSSAAFPAMKRANDITSIATNGAGRTQCMQVWPPNNKKKFETLSYLPPLTDEQLNKQVDYLLKHQWIPCVEFTVDYPHVHRENHRSPGYYDGRYWTMWKLPMFGCTDSSQVLKEIEEVKKAYPVSHVRIIGFDNIQQVQCCSFIVHKPQP